MPDAIRFSNVDEQSFEVGRRNGLPTTRYGLPSGAVPLFASSGNIAAGVAAATLTGVAGKETWLQGFSLRGAGATAGLPVIVTLTGLGTTLSFIYCAAAGVLVANTPLDFHPPEALKAAAVGGNFVVSCPSLGAGNTHNCVNVWGYSL